MHLPHHILPLQHLEIEVTFRIKRKSSLHHIFPSWESVDIWLRKSRVIDTVMESTDRTAEEDVYRLCAANMDVTQINIEKGDEFAYNSRSQKLYVR